MIESYVIIIAIFLMPLISLLLVWGGFVMGRRTRDDIIPLTVNKKVEAEVEEDEYDEASMIPDERIPTIKGD